MRKIRKLNESKNVEFKKQFFVLDVETYGLNPKPDKLAFGVVYGFNYIKVLRTPKDFKDEFKKPIYKNKKVFAHNAEYDLSSIFGNVIENVDEQAIFNGKFISINYGKTVFVDSLNLYPASLDKIGGLMGQPKGTTPEKFINPDKFTAHEKRINENDISYCVTDCKIIYDALLQLFERVGGLRITIASTAMYYFRKRFLKNDILYSPLNNNFFESYFGGRTEAFKIGEVNANVYDINSLYPDIMRTINFPDVKNLNYIKNVENNYFKKLLKFKEGYAKVTLFHDNTYFGFIPVKDKNTKKLIFPVGRFTAYTNFNELRFALEKGAIKILKVHYCVFGNPTKTIFNEYVTDLYNERKNSNNELERTILKLLLNSLYGRFGMREKYTTTYYKKIPHALINNLRVKNKYCKVSYFNKERNDCYVTTENVKMKNSFFAIPSIASYITSAARIKLLSGLLENENNKVVYCDTDSIFLEDDTNIQLPISNELGDWKLEDKKVIEVRGLKNYTYIENGITKDAIKGVSKHAQKIGKNTFEVVKYIKTKEAIRRNKETGSQVIVKKTITNKYDKRIILPDGNTEPIKL